MQKSLVRLFYSDIWNKGDKSRIPDVLHEDFTFRGSLGPVLVGHEAFAGYVDGVLTALGNYTCDILDMVEEENRIAAKMLFHGDHQGEFFGFAPTGSHVEWHGAAFFTFEDGLVRDLWVLGDVHGLLQQLEANAR